MDNLVDPTEEKNNDSNQTETSSDSPIQKGKEIARENDETEQPSSSELEIPVLQDIPQSDNLDVPPGLSGSVSGLNNQEQEPNIQLEEEAFIGDFGTQEIRSGNVDLQPTTINNDQQPQNEVIEVIQNQTQTENASLNDNKTDQIDNQVGDQIDNQVYVNDQQSDQIENQDENEQYEEIKTQIYIQNV
ncbi:MAG: hypothetical protein EZS28_045553 [Streblomastix strix]|uniref:Uncharacterized protein n=1 Tax=Streblomastix strix TaxID=222440 RepID=A0A5J4TNC9_9EUKA|nr:MAG: hypothetical protein EZS28_045553 [Streblomastix strix]